MGNELGHYGISIGTAIFRIYSIRVIKIGAGVLKGDGDHPGEIVRCPDFIKSTFFSESGWRAEREMSLSVVNRIKYIRVSVIALRKKDYCA
jgi:hypothetical protein